jgi:hypothetical protein
VFGVPLLELLLLELGVGTTSSQASSLARAPPLAKHEALLLAVALVQTSSSSMQNGYKVKLHVPLMVKVKPMSSQSSLG